jgi:hypothetical protein
MEVIANEITIFCGFFRMETLQGQLIQFGMHYLKKSKVMGIFRIRWLILISYHMI